MTWFTLIFFICVALALIGVGLRIQYTRKASPIGTALVFVGCVVAFHLIPLLGFPWPQLSVREGTNGWRNILSIRVAWLVDVAEWALITIAFTWLAHRVRAILLIPLSLGVIAAAAFGVPFVVRLLGMNFYWVWK